MSGAAESEEELSPLVRRVAEEFRNRGFYVVAWALQSGARDATPAIRNEIEGSVEPELAPSADAFVVAWVTKDWRRMRTSYRDFIAAAEALDAKQMEGSAP